MPEGDAVFRTAQRLSALNDEPLTRWDLRWPGCSTSDYRGSRVLETATVGKHMLTRLDAGVTLHTHLRMDGRWQVTRTLEPSREGHQVRALIATEDYRAIGRLLGMVNLVPTTREHDVVGHLGPDALVEGWHSEEALERYRRLPAMAAGSALLRQDPMCGLGTIWVSETLFVARISPLRPLAEVTDEDLLKAIDIARRLLRGTLAYHSSVSTGDPRNPTYVYGRAPRPCKRCRTSIRRSEVGTDHTARKLYWCPTCQV